MEIFTTPRYVAIYARPSHSTRRSVLWVENNLPIRRIVRHLVASRMRLNLTMEEILIVKQNLRDKHGSLHTWGCRGSVQIYVDRN